MHFFLKNVLIISICALEGCESKDLEPTTSLVRIYVSSTISSSNSTIGTIEFGLLRLNYSDMKFTSMDLNNGTDSVITKTSLQGPDLIELNYYLGGYDFKIDSTHVPNGLYQNLYFKITPCQLPESIQGMHGKSIRLEATIGNTQIRYWHNREIKIKTHLPDSLLTIAKGTPFSLMIYFDLNKALDPQFGGADLSKAIDGNHDGIISIDPTNEDGNAELANAVFNAIVKNISCKKKELG